MPRVKKSKKELSDSGSSDASDNESGSEEEAPARKQAAVPKNGNKKAAPPAASESDDSDVDRPAPTPPKNAGGSSKIAGAQEPSWALDSKRTLKIRDFKGKRYVDIREYYEKDGKTLPGKKGISLSVDQWNKVVAVVGEVNAELKK